MNLRKIAVSATVVFLSVTAVRAGDLNPPAGPVAPTFKTLHEVEPRTPVEWLPSSGSATYAITAPGSYYLTGNIVGEVGKHAIEIDASNVTLDLRGFHVQGIYEAGAAGVFVIASKATRHNIAVYNGSVEGWSDSGINLFTASNSRVERIRASSNSSGIELGYNSAVVDCHAELNFDVGISTRDICVVRDCTVLFNSNGGIRAGEHASISGCVAENNTYGGIFVSVSSIIHNCAARYNGSAPAAAGGGGGGGGHGFQLDDSCTIANCAADLNYGSGITGYAGCSITNCTVRSNGYHGIDMTSGAGITDCSASNNGANGYDLAENGVVKGAVAEYNGASGLLCTNNGTIANSTFSNNVLHGAEAFDGVTMTNSTASVNGGNGIYINTGALSGCTTNDNGGYGIQVFIGDATIESCTASLNNESGIRVETRCVVRDNNCTQNGSFGGGVSGAGVLVIGADNRIDGNNVGLNDGGIDVSTPGLRNLIIRNTARNNTTNYVLDPANDIGPIGTAAASTSPWANISY